MYEDLRDALRSLSRHPRLTLFAASILAIAFTATGLVVALVNDVLLRPLPFPSAERLVMVWDTHRQEPGFHEMTSMSNYLDYRSRSVAFAEMTAWLRPASMTLVEDGGAVELTASVVTTTFFSVLGTPPSMGRDFRPEDGNAGNSRVAILSHELWQRRFGSAPDILGRSLLLDDVSYRVIGVAPAGLENPIDRTELWVPLVLRPNAIDRGQNYLRVLARLREGTSLEKAQAEMDVLGAALGREFPATNAERTPRLVRLSDQILGSTRPVLVALLGAVIFLLLVSAANVSNLQLVRIVGREAELAVRLSLGASKRALFRLALIEQGLMAVFAAGLSLAAIPAIFPHLSTAVGPHLPRLLAASVDATTLLATVALGLVACLAFFLPTALYASRFPRNGVPRHGRATAPAGRLRRTLVVAQIGLSLALLVGSALLATTLFHIGRVPLGFRPANVLVLRLALGDRYREDERRIAYFRGLLPALEALPSVRSAGAATVIPMSSFGIDFDVPYYLPGEPEPERADAPKARFRSVTPGGLEALGTTLLEGRAFTWEDDSHAPRVVLVNRTLAERIWGAKRALGKELRFFWADWQSYEVVGVVSDSRAERLTRAAPPQLFVPYGQYPYVVMNVVLHSSGDPESLVEAARSAVLGVDPQQPVSGTSTMAELVAASTSRETLAGLLLGAVAATALLLSLLGIYAMVSFSMQSRTREIAIRAALGANPGALLKWALGEGARSALVGIGVGLVVTLASTERLSDLLFGVGPRDPFTLAAASSLLFAASMFSSYFAVRRVVAIDPAVAFRSSGGSGW